MRHPNENRASPVAEAVWNVGEDRNLGSLAVVRPARDGVPGHDSGRRPKDRRACRCGLSSRYGGGRGA